jgi:hypothetical protein
MTKIPNPNPKTPNPSAINMRERREGKRPKEE